MNKMKVDISGEARILKSEIRIDEGRGLDPKRKRDRMETVNNNLTELYNKIGNEMKNIQDNIKENCKDDNLINSNADDKDENAKNIDDKNGGLNNSAAEKNADKAGGVYNHKMLKDKQHDEMNLSILSCKVPE